MNDSKSLARGRPCEASSAGGITRRRSASSRAPSAVVHADGAGEIACRAPARSRPSSGCDLAQPRFAASRSMLRLPRCPRSHRPPAGRASRKSAEASARPPRMPRAPLEAVGAIELTGAQDQGCGLRGKHVLRWCLPRERRWNPSASVAGSDRRSTRGRARRAGAAAGAIANVCDLHRGFCPLLSVPAAGGISRQRSCRDACPSTRARVDDLPTPSPLRRCA